MKQAEGKASARLPRVGAFHDLSGYGKCALTVAIPVISACGAEVCPAPTAVLSAHTGLEGFTLLDFSDQLPAYLDHWMALGVRLDAVYSGFLASPRQVALLTSVTERFAPEMRIVDPVMGDHGVLYATVTEELCRGMRRLLPGCTVTTPNLTEAFVLAGEPYCPDPTERQVEDLARRILAMGAGSVVITGVRRGETLENVVASAKGVYRCALPGLPYTMSGAGDLFASVLTGGLVTGHPLEKCVESAAAFVALCMEASLAYGEFDRRGICFEPYLARLSGGIFA